MAMPAMAASKMAVSFSLPVWGETRNKSNADDRHAAKRMGKLPPTLTPVRRRLRVAPQSEEE
eukprot:scaffold635_cov155-Amphora_coffeaeformis.AAC.1